MNAKALFLCSVSVGIMSTAAGTNQLFNSWVDLEKHDGEAGAAPISRTDYRQLVFELQQTRENMRVVGSQRMQAAPLDAPEAYDQIAEPRNNERHQVALSLLHWQRLVVDDAASIQAMAERGDAESVETNVTVFAFSPLNATTYRGGYLEMTFRQADFFEEVGGAERHITELRLDAGDGVGSQPVEWDEPLVVSYDATGAKTLSLEAVTADGTVLHAESTLQVAALATPDPTQTVRIQADSPYADHWGSLYIYQSGSHAGLRCPVFVVEGFDINNDMDWDVIYNILNKEQLAETLRSYGRDLIVLDFDDATADIFGNASLAMEAIYYINDNRYRASDKFTVIGASMGGLITRKALATMDRYPSLYGYGDVNTWISFDSPHTGANFPLGVQEYFNFFGGFAGKYSDLAVAREYRDKLNTPAASQMLISHYTCTDQLAGANPSYAWFWDSMNSYGWPTSCKTVAISNGSGYGYKQPFDPGEQIIQWHSDDGITLEIGSRIYALYKSAATAKTVFYGRFDPWDWFDLIDESVYERSYSPYGLDNASGGTRDTFQELFDQLPYKNSDDWCNYSDHCFIPTCSSLGIPLSQIEQTIHNNGSVSSLSPFDEIHYAIDNEEHIEINARNKRWFMRAVLEDYDTDRDGFDDYQEYLLGTAYNNASDKLAFSIEFDVGAASSATLRWQALANTRYDVYKAEALAGAWQYIESVELTQAGTVGRSYAMDDGATNAFFKVSASPIDPVTD
ncbi:esterase/lipase family protein [Pontiella sp.]|uniref:esterase/lipase family protein n=2 Tax=Pontiella sp. TaxID=2837462 RepID=UPI0035692086